MSCSSEGFAVRVNYATKPSSFSSKLRLAARASSCEGGFLGGGIQAEGSAATVAHGRIVQAVIWGIPAVNYDAMFHAFVGGHPDLPAGGHEENAMAITERDRIR